MSATTNKRIAGKGRARLIGRLDGAVDFGVSNSLPPGVDPVPATIDSNIHSSKRVRGIGSGFDRSHWRYLR